MKTLNLENFGVLEMNAEEMEAEHGGVGVPGWLKKLGWGYVISEVVDHWSEIKKGFKDGYQAQI